MKGKRISPRKVRRTIGWFFFYLCVVLVVAIAVFPIFWTIMTSLKSERDAFTMPPKWVFTPTFENYKAIFQRHSFARYIVNSVAVGGLSTLLSLALGLPAAYALSRFRLRRGKDIAFFILSTRIAPPVLVILPFYLLFSQLNLLDSHLALTIVYLTFNLSFVVWLMKAFFDDLPRELDEAAMVDGCSRLQAFIRIILPLSKSGLAATTILCLIASWNEFLFAMILSGQKVRTLPVAITSFIQFTGTRWGELSAAATVMIAPLLIFGFLVQKRLVAGMTFGAIK